MVAFLFQGLLDSGPLSYFTGISDLDVHMRGGTPVLYAASGASGGITSYRLDGASPALLDREAFGAGEIHATAGRLEQIALDGGAVMVTLGRQSSGLQYYDVTGSGQLAAAGQLTAPGGLQAAVVSMATVSVAGTTYAYASHLGMDGLTVYALDGAGQMTLLAQQAQSGQSVSGADLLAVERVEAGGQDYLITLSAQGDSVASYRVGADGMLSEVATAGAHKGLGISGPTALAQMQVGGQTYLAVAAADSSSLSILRLEPDGTFTPTDHVVDQLHTRFQGVSALEAVSIGDRAFLVAGGSDDGLSLFTLLPGGRLLHLDRIVDSEGMTLANIAALALDVQDGIIHVFASSQAAAGITHLTVDPGTIGQSYLSDDAGSTVSGSGAGDVLVGGIGNDKLRAQGGDDILIDGAGSDQLRGGGGADVFIFTPDGERDTVEDFELGIDRLDLSGLGRIYSLSQLSITPTSWGVRIWAGDEEILLYSSDGLPIDPAALRLEDLVDLAHFPVIPTSPDEHLKGGPGDDTLSGYNGNDTLLGLGGSDSLLGGAGNDTLEGGTGNDSILGQDGNDVLIGQAGNDMLEGGSGSDTLDGTGGNDTLWGGAEADLLYGGTEHDILYGGGGNDRLYGGPGFDRLEGGDGNDTLDGGGQADNLFGGTGNDMLRGGDGLDRLFGGAGQDQAFGGAGNDGLFGQQGNDSLFGDIGNDRFFGGIGNDRLHGQSGNDTLYGGAGFDTLNGGFGNDQLSGNYNADTFVFANGFSQDVITDFAANNDLEKIDLSGVSSITDFTDLSANHMSQAGANLVIDAGGGNTITLLGVSLGDLDALDFIF